jgi:transcriptional regulator with XRE-family HTH domain
MDNYSIMLDFNDSGSDNLNQRIARRVHDLRASRGLSLDALATQSGVSRSMISLIERGESSPTAVVLEKLATGLNVTLASLFELPRADAEKANPVARYADQPLWKDPHSGYVRRNVSPTGCSAGNGDGNMRSPIQIVEVSFPPKARVAYETAAREPLVHQQVWVLDGAMDITVGDELHKLKAGDCLAHVLDRPMSFHNPSRKTARYVVVIATLPASPTYWK